MKKDLLKQIIRSFHVATMPDLFSRALEVPLDTEKIVTIIGVRRSGKTSFLFNIIGELLDRDVERSRILYVNFEDERLNLKAEELDLILQAYLELYPDLNLRDCYFFFDEIQNIADWDKFIRRVYDSITKNIVITGSNARFLSSEIATSLRGRTISYEVFPLSFSEYLEFKDVSVDLYDPNSIAQIKYHLGLYLIDGGFPEVINYEDDLRIKVLQEYFNVMIYRDLVERYEIKNLSALRFFLKRVLASSTKQLSVNNIYNELKSAGIKIGKNQLYDFLDACQNTYLVFMLKKHIRSMADRELGEKKVYAIDNGLLNSIEYKFSDDVGKAMEQVVFLDLRREGREVYFYKSRNECDFIVKKGTDVTNAIQVSYSLSDKKTRRREIAGLVSACKEFGLKEGIIITDDEREELEIDGVNVNVLPLHRWLLDKSAFM